MANVIRHCLSACLLILCSSAAVVAQEGALPVDTNSPEVRQAQRDCVAKLKVELLQQNVRRTAWGAEQEAFERCKEITGWQSPR